ncbi:MAG: hypothetical protein EXS03_06110 [Phycisphaerales bacterium]|nr:hypothetical protein [Phycisphaerales bacterium]
MKTRSQRLLGHFSVCAAAMATVATASQSDAAVVHSGVINVVIQANIDGLYVNCQTGQYLNGPGSGVPGWDVNPYGTSLTGVSLYAATGTGYMRNPGAGTSTSRTNIAARTAIGAASFFYGSSNATIGTLVGQWTANSTGIFGFKFLAADGLTHYGWARMSIGANAATRTLVEYAWNDVAGVTINAGDVGPPPPPACSGDFNLDGFRDGLDMAVILSGWGTASGDLNSDGTTDGLDMAVILSGWGTCP